MQTNYKHLCSSVNLLLGNALELVLTSAVAVAAGQVYIVCKLSQKLSKFLLLCWKAT